MKKITIKFAFGLVAASLLAACNGNGSKISPDTKGSVSVEFENTFGGNPLEFGKQYVNAQSEKFTVTTFNYFISNIKLRKTDGTEFTVPQDSSYFLVKGDEANTHILKLSNVPGGDYNGITFTIGVDSLRNTLDVSRRTGALDMGKAASGMYWRWNSGYIFLMMEGKSEAAPDSLLNQFYYHIGGFGGYDSKTINNIRTKTIDFGSSRIMVKADKKPVIHLSVDVEEFFKGPANLSIRQYPTVMFAPYSTTISAQYLDMFKFDHVHN